MRLALIQSLTCLFDVRFFFAKGEPDHVFAEFDVLWVVEARAWNCYHTDFFRKLHAERHVSGPLLLSFFVDQIAFLNRHRANVSHDKIAAFGDPHLKIVWRVEKLIDEESPVVDESICILFHVIVLADDI